MFDQRTRLVSIHTLSNWRIILKENIKVTANCAGYKKQYLKNYCPLSKTEIQRQKFQKKF